MPAYDALNELPDSMVASARRPLRAGTRLGEIEIGEVIAQGSVAIVYAGVDRALELPVAVAEYMPARLAQRQPDAQVVPRSLSHADAFTRGLEAFIDETRKLARCDHASLVRVVHLVDANATAYRVMPRYPARRLLDVRRGMREPPDEAALRALLDALLGALDAFHRASGRGHGNVTPSDIVLLGDNRPVLLAPGAARRAIETDPIDELTSSAEPCFAPLEQIVEADRPLQPSVDLYALAGVARFWLSGELPPPFGARSSARPETVANTVRRLGLTRPRLRYSASLVDALDRALSIYPAQRPQSVAQMRERLAAAPPAGGGTASTASIPDAATSAATVPGPPSAPKLPTLAPDADAVMALPSTAGTAPGVDGIDEDSLERPPLPHQAHDQRRIGMGTGVMLLVLALAAIGAYALREEQHVARALDALGMSNRPGATQNASVSRSPEGPATPTTPPTGGDARTAGASARDPVPDAGGAKSTPPEAPSAPSTPSAGASVADTSGGRASLSPVPAPAAVAQPRLPGGSPAPPAAPNASHAPTSPRAACGARTEFALYRCMQRECSQRQWESHPQCVRLRTRDSVD